MSIRAKGDKIGMWLGDSNAGDSILMVGKKFKERLNIDPQVGANFPCIQFHEIFSLNCNFTEKYTSFKHTLLIFEKCCNIDIIIW